MLTASSTTLAFESPKLTPTAHANLGPSLWVQRWSHLIASGSSVLDVACGSGRHARWFAGRGCTVTAIDRDAQALDALRDVARTLSADIENGPWPLPGERFDAVVVTNYLWRELMPNLLASLNDDGVLIYETFAQGNASVGKPSNPNFLLRTGELLQAFNGLRVVAFEDGFLESPQRFVQRVVAVRETAITAGDRRYLL